jgi:hypothetical protein
MLFIGLPEKVPICERGDSGRRQDFVQVTKDTGINGIVYVPAGK